MSSPTIHIVDDDDAIRESLAFLLTVQGYGCRVHESARAFLDAAGAQSVDCLVTDVRMPDMTGLELIRKLNSDGTGCPIIVMTGHGDIALAVACMKAGVVDFIEKPFSDETLLAAIDDALAGRHRRADREEAERRLATLSPRERAVLAGVVSGKINKVIAHDLEISPRTVEIYRANLMAKTGARNMSELMRLALNAGL